jgi:hypothetical protein
METPLRLERLPGVQLKDGHPMHLNASGENCGPVVAHDWQAEATLWMKRATFLQGQLLQLGYRISTNEIDWELAKANARDALSAMIEQGRESSAPTSPTTEVTQPEGEPGDRGEPG